jgi:lipoyl-dependent peroxiredoxin
MSVRQIEFMNRKASVIWEGTFQQGAGALSTESRALSGMAYSYRTCFEKEIGGNPDELIAAALGGSYSMGLSKELGLVGLSPSRINTTVTATLEKLSGEWTMTRIQLDVRAQVPGATQSEFITAALEAKAKSPIARLLDANISMTASLNSANKILQF